MKKMNEDETEKSNTEHKDSPKNDEELESVQDFDHNLSVQLAENMLQTSPEKPGPPPAKKYRAHQNQVEDFFQETAEDLLHLMERVNHIEQQIGKLDNSVIEISRKIDGAYRDHAVALEKLKADLLSDRKALAARSTFNAIIPAIESLEISQSRLKEIENDPSYKRISGVIDLLYMILQGLGYETYSPDIGDHFDPVSMECIDYAEGEEGTVVKVGNPGYRAGDQIIKPSRVILGNNKTDK